MQKLLTADQERRLLQQGRDRPTDAKPLVKLFTPWAAATWLISELDPEEPHRAFGLCDVGQGFPELGYVDLREVRDLRGPGGLYVERDIHFEPVMTLTAYADAARSLGRIAA